MIGTPRDGRVFKSGAQVTPITYFLAYGAVIL